MERKFARSISDRTVKQYSLEHMSMKRTRTNQYLERGIRNSSVLVMRADARPGIVHEDVDYVPPLPARQ